MDKAIKKCRAKELTTQQAQELSKAKESPNVNTVNRGGARRKVRAQNKPAQNKPKKKPPSQKTETSQKCGRCGKSAHKN